MSAAEALRAARDAGIGLHVDGVDLVLEASAPPSAAVLDLLTRHKADLIVLLQPRVDGWSDEDWRALYDERAGIAEFDGGLPRPEAETLAFRMLRRRMAEPQFRVLAARQVPRLRRWR